MNKRILISLTIIAVVAAVVIGGTIAYFSDIETSTGNTFRAGTLNLTIDGNDDHNTVKFEVANIKPGDYGKGTWTLVNTGSINGYLDLENIKVTNNEGSNPEAETNTEEPGDLAANMNIVLFWDDGAGGGTANNGIRDGAEMVIYEGKLSEIVASYNTNYPLASGSTTYITLNWEVPSDVGNDIQGDIVAFDLTFELAQTEDQ